MFKNRELINNLNWPGALTIVEALKALPEDVFKKMILKIFYIRQIRRC